MTQTSAAPLAGRRILVTGASRGLGREMALALAEAGADLALMGARPGAALDATVAEAEALGATVVPLTCDVADPDACAAAMEAVITRFGGLDVLVNNAGLGMRAISERFNTVPTRFWEADPAAWAAIVATNVNGPFYLARLAAQQMVAQGAGKIVNISTSDQTMVRRGYSPYGPSKAALEAASRVWAQDLAGTGVTVNVYLPGGAADTDLLPPSANKRGADGNLLPAGIMRRAILWHCGPGSDGQTGGRYIARLWDDSLPEAAAAEGARCRSVEKPEIM
jgi:3-oxoacyl-[acyl-carrier protein] reductase